MKYLLLSVLVVSLVAVMSVPDAFAATYTDPNNKFSIEYPSGWLKEIIDSSSGDVRFTDKYNWNADIQVFNYDLSFTDYRGMSDSSILEELKEQERNQCNTSTYQDNTFVCYNYQLVSADYFLTEQNKTAYFVNSKYTKQYEGFSGEQPIQRTNARVIEGDYHWEITSEMKKEYVDRYFDMILRNALSFKLLQGQGVTQSTSPSVPTSTSFKKYTDDDNRFVIVYPDNWVLSDSHPDEIIAIQDKYNWRTNFQVFWNYDDTLDNRSDSKVLRAIERNQSEDCDDETGGVRKCSDFKILDSYVMYTDDNKKVYFVKMAYTIVWKNISGKITGKEYPIVSVVGLIYDGNGSWFMQTESHEEVFANHSDEIIHMMKSFSFSSQSQSTPAPTPAPTYEDPFTSYWGSIVELDKVYYKQNDVVNFLIVTPSFNANSNVVEYIGTDANSRVTIITSQGTLDFYKLKETGVDTGVFEGSISLNSVSTTGMGPWSGNIKTSNKDTITVQFSNTYSGNVDTVKAQGFVEGPSVTTPTPTPPTESVTSIPHWIKNNAEWWADGIIDDSSFLQGIEYLINEGIIVIPPTTTSGASGSQEVPAWVKKNASWWVDGTIDDATFVSGIQYLVQVGIIQVG